MTLSVWRCSWNSSKQNLCPLLCCIEGHSSEWRQDEKLLQECWSTAQRPNVFVLIWLREKNREIFHMFISRTPRDKQPSTSLSLLLLKAQPAQVIKILPSQGEITLCLVAKAQSWKDSSCALSLYVYLSNLNKMYLSGSSLHHLSPEMFINHAHDIKSI